MTRERFAEPVVTIYRCRKCKEIDSDRGLSLPAPNALSCGACGAGRNLSLDQMAQYGEGMFPVPAEEAAKILKEREAADGRARATAVPA